MEIEQTLDEKEAVADNTNHKLKGATWTNDDKVELLKLRLQGLTFEEIGGKIGRTKHAARSEYGRIRRGEVDATVSLKQLPELRKILPTRKV